jgi:hypothetical protein
MLNVIEHCNALKGKCCESTLSTTTCFFGLGTLKRSPSQHYALNVKEEVYYIAVLDCVVFTFGGEFSGGTAGAFRFKGNKVIVLYHFCAYEASFEVGVYCACGFRGFIAYADSPGSAFIRADSEEGVQTEQAVGFLNQADNSGFLKT